jgi:hypothetical protein
MEPEEWNQLPNNGARIGPPTQAEHWRRIQARAETLHAERMVEAAKREEEAKKQRMYAQLPKGSNKLRNKTVKIEHYQKILEEIQSIKKMPMPLNTKSIVASHITGLEKMSLNQQENKIKNMLKTLKNIHQIAGTRKNRHHLKRRFKSSKRKTT